MRALFYDTETSGLPIFEKPSEHPEQPHIVQLGAILVDLENRRELASVDITISPVGWQIPDDVAKIHGITTAHALQVGVPESLALRVFVELWGRADLRIAHNETFDSRIVRIGLSRFPLVDPDVWKKGRAECTQVMSTPILKLPPTARMLAAGFNKHKSANLREAYQFFMGRELVGAHSAIVDARGCMDVYHAIRARKAA